MSHIFQICPIAFASHGDNVPYDIFSFKITVCAYQFEKFYQIIYTGYV